MSESDRSPKNSEQIKLEIQECREKSEQALRTAMETKADFLVEKDKRHEVHEVLADEIKTLGKCIKVLTDNGKMAADVLYGNEKLQINGLVKDNQESKSFIKRIKWGLSIFGATGVLITFILNVIPHIK